MTMFRLSRTRISEWGVAATVALLAVSGCGTPPLPDPYVPRSAVAPEIVHCNDHTGHKSGAKPWILGGTCCCTPTPELMAALHRDGICVGMTAEDLRAKYQSAGIKLRSPDHDHCNGLCERGPHVVLGGKCMCPPTPGTEYYERVVAGRGVPPRDAAPVANPLATNQ